MSLVGPGVLLDVGAVRQVAVVGPGNGLGNGGVRLHAVVVGRNTFDYAGHWGGDHHGAIHFDGPTGEVVGENLLASVFDIERQ